MFECDPAKKCPYGIKLSQPKGFDSDHTRIDIYSIKLLQAASIRSAHLLESKSNLGWLRNFELYNVKSSLKNVTCDIVHNHPVSDSCTPRGPLGSLCGIHPLISEASSRYKLMPYCSWYATSSNIRKHGSFPGHHIAAAHNVTDTATGTEERPVRSEMMSRAFRRLCWAAPRTRK